MTTRGKAFVDLSGVVVLVIDINFYNIKTLGRHKGRKLAQKLQQSVHVNPKSLLIEVVDSILNFSKGNEDVLFIPGDIPLPSLSILHRAAEQIGLSVAIGLGNGNIAKGFGIIDCSEMDPFSRKHLKKSSYPREVYRVYNALVPQRTLKETPMTNSDVFQAFYKCALVEIGLYLPQPVVETVLEYVGNTLESVMRENLQCDCEKLSIGDLVEWI